MQNNHLVNEKALDAIYRVADTAGMPIVDPDKVRPLCLHNLIDNLLEIARCFINDTVQIPQFASYIVHYFINKFDKRSQSSHAMYTLLYSWKSMMEMRMECRLLATMLENQRGSKNSLKHFLKIRREVTKMNPLELLDEIYLIHQETIAIVHRLYDESKRKSICKWLNDFYINMNYRQVNNAKLQSCIFVEFLMNCQGQMNQLDKEVRITNRNSRRENPGLFSSRIDKNNGFNIIKGKVDLNRQCFTDRFAQSKISYSKVIRTVRKESSPGESITKLQKIKDNREELAEMHSNQIVSRLFDNNESPPIKSSLSELSPTRLFLTAEKSFQKLTKIDQQLDSRRAYIKPKAREHSEQPLKEHSSSNLVEKYTEDWEKMLERNQSFKEKMLKKSRVAVDRKKKLLEESLDMKEDKGGKELHFYERNGHPEQLSPKHLMKEHQISSFNIDSYNKQEISKNNFDNFSFKDNSDHDEHFKIPEIRESVKVKTLFK